MKEGEQLAKVEVARLPPTFGGVPCIDAPGPCARAADFDVFFPCSGSLLFISPWT